MDNKKELLMFLSLVDGMLDENYLDNTLDFILDAEVNDCLIKMYCFMMTEVGNPDHERIYNEFLISYHSLNEKQQEIVKNDFKKIIEAQDGHKKVKRKGEIKYE